MRGTILVTGSRTWDDLATMRAWLEPAFKRWPRLVDGGAKGADDQAAMIAAWLRPEFTIHGLTYRVDEKLGGPWPGAGPRRNQRMVDKPAARGERYSLTVKGEM